MGPVVSRKMFLHRSTKPACMPSCSRWLSRRAGKGFRPLGLTAAAAANLGHHRRPASLRDQFELGSETRGPLT
jgi:hypothetical protein